MTPTQVAYLHETFKNGAANLFTAGVLHGLVEVGALKRNHAGLRGAVARLSDDHVGEFERVIAAEPHDKERNAALRALIETVRRARMARAAGLPVPAWA